MTSKSSSHFLAEVLNLAVVAAFACGYGTRPLVDLDLGWHLAGGLWILDHGAVPWRDFLGIDAREWISYSWLPEAILAALYRWKGFAALAMLQTALMLVSALTLYMAFKECARRAFHGEDAGLRLRLVPIVAFLLAMQFLAPVWYLRPQLVSVILFTILVARAESDELRPVNTIPLAILWANVHVMWVFVPGIVFLYGIFRSSKRERLESMIHAAVLSAAGLCTPYGIATYRVLVDYGIHHREAYLLIKEFAPLMPDIGYLFWLFAATGFAAAFVLKEMLEGGRRATGILFVALFLAAASQRKYLPYYGIVAGVVLAGDILPAIFRRRSLAREQQALDHAPPGVLLGAGTLCALFATCFFFFFPAQPPTLPFQRELLDLGKTVTATTPEGSPPYPVLNYFDDGGWVGLALYHARPKGIAESHFKTTIDGRTLVMGEERLKQFRELITGTHHICEILAKWKPAIADRLLIQKRSPTGNVSSLGEN